MEQSGQTLGEKIRIERKKKGLTQKDLAGDFITRTMLSKIENDMAKPSIKTIEYISSVLNVPVAYFLESMVSGDIKSKTNMEGVFEHSSFLIKNKEYEKAIAYIKEMLEINERETEDIYYLGSIYNLTTCYAKLNKVEELEKNALSILDSLKGKKDFYYLSKTYERIGLANHKKGNYDLAEKNYRQGLKYLEESYVEDTLYKQILYYNIGHCFYKEGQLDKAVESLENVKKISKEYCCYYNAASVNMLLGLIELARDNLSLAIKYTNRAVCYFEENNEKYYTALCNENLGVMYINQREYSNGIIHLDRALRYFNESKNEQKCNSIKSELALALSKQESYEESYKYINNIDFEQLSDKNKADYYISLSRYYIYRDQLEKAKETLHKVKQLTDDKYILKDYYTDLAHIYSLKGDYQKAYEISDKLLKRYFSN